MGRGGGGGASSGAHAGTAGRGGCCGGASAGAARGVNGAQLLRASPSSPSLAFAGLPNSSSGDRSADESLISHSSKSSSSPTNSRTPLS